ncbi:MAG: hypothetical protein IH899_02470, partial [Planctomycetes bacterium]|nr:hypothetical protein [Planctomycetota bacterium]
WPGIAKISQAELAAIVEKSHPELAERLSSTVELNDPNIPERHRGSALMQELLTKQTLSATTSLAFSESVSNQRSVRATLVGSAAVLLLMLPFLFSPKGYGLLWQRFFSPWGNFESGGNLYFEVENGNRVVARGSDVVIRAKPHWRQSAEERPQTVWLNWSDSTGESDSRRMDFNEQSETYVTTLPHIFDPFDFDISSGRARTQRFHVSVEEAPAVTSATLDVQPPAYTGMNALHHDGVIGEIPVYANSGLTFRLLFNKPVEAAELVWANENDIALQKNDEQPENQRENQPEDALRRPAVSFVLSADRKSAELETTAKIGGRFLFLLTDEHKLHNQQEPRRVLVITSDAAPLIELAGSDQPRLARPTDHVAVDVSATDDIGVTELELHYDILNGHQGMLTVDAAELGGQTVTHQFDLDLSSLGLAEGDAVTYRIRAADERPVPGPNESWSVTRVLTISENAKSLNSIDIAEMQNAMQQSLDAIREELRKNREQVADLQKTAQSNLQQEKPFQRNDELPELGQQQFQLAQRLERLSWDFAQHPLYQNLTEKMQEVSRKDLPEASQTIRQAASADAREKVAGLKQNENQLQQAENKLKDIAGTFDELAELERDLLDLNRLAEEAEQLAQNLRDLENMLNNPPAGETPQQKQAREQELAQQQQALQQQQQQQKEELDDLLERRPELIEAARQQQLKQLAELARRLLQLAEPEDLLAETLQEESQRPAGDSDNQPETQSDPSNPQNQTPQQPNARQAQSQQQKLARDAAQLALDVARQMGPASPAAQKAAEFARECFT